MPEAVAIIPARFASTRFPGKPLHLIAGRPLIQHVWERCRRAKSLARILIATDDARIAETASSFGAEVAMTSARHRSGTDRLAEAAAKLPRATHILNVQGDEPLIDPALIDRLARTLIADPVLDMITAATPFAPDEAIDNPNAVKVVLDRESHALYFSRAAIPFARDNAKPTFYKHQGIYGYTRRFLLQFVKWKPTPLENCEQLEQLRALEHGTRIRVLLTKRPSIGVDSPADAALVERLLSTK